jgi:hypothetical protein
MSDFKKINDKRLQLYIEDVLTDLKNKNLILGFNLSMDGKFIVYPNYVKDINLEESQVDIEEQNSLE